jgi:hypothetical protein
VAFAIASSLLARVGHAFLGTVGYGMASLEAADAWVARRGPLVGIF